MISGKQITENSILPDRLTDTCPEASQASWFIDGQNVTGLASDMNDGATAVTPLLTDQERARRIGGSPVQIAMTENLLSDLQAEDFVTQPKVGIDGFFLVTGAPGATIVHAGVLTAAVAQTGNSPGTVTDALVNWTAIGAIGKRLRVTGGPRAGAVTWLVHDNGLGVAVASDPEILATDPAQVKLASVALQLGDPYVVENLPLIPNILSPFTVADGENGGGAFVRVMYESVSFPNTTFTVPDLDDAFTIQFVGCNAGSIAATAIFLACGWFLPNISLLQWSPSIEAFVLGSVMSFSGGPEFGAYVASGTSLTLDQGTLLFGGPIFVNGWVGIGVDTTGTFAGGTAGVCNSAGDGVIVTPGGTLRADTLLWGSGNAGHGVRVQSLGNGSYVTKPSITGAGGDAIVGGASFPWGAIPQLISAANGAALVPIV